MQPEVSDSNEGCGNFREQSLEGQNIRRDKKLDLNSKTRKQNWKARHLAGKTF